MKKKILLSSLIGAPIGLTISYIITVIISISIGDGSYYPVVPEFADACGSEINAVVIQALCSLLYGASWGGASVIWNMQEWSLLRMSVTHLAVSSVFSFPIAYVMHWMPHNVKGILIYFAIFIAIYAVIWLSQYASIKKKIEQLNKQVMNIK